jgi:hypothetical protein
MRKTSVYFISLLSVIFILPLEAQTTEIEPPDSVEIPLKIMAGIEVTGPVIYFTDKKILSAEGFVSLDLDENKSIFFGGGFADYEYSQYNYSFLSSGTFFKAGVDFNLMKPEKSMGKYRAGIGIHYGLSAFSSEIPSFTHENYWGITTSSVGRKNRLGHFIEATPGFRAEVLPHVTIGWSVVLRKLIYGGPKNEIKPIFMPGYGLGGKAFSTGINYYLVWHFSYKKIKVEIKPEPVEEPEEGAELQTTGITR